MCQADVSSVMEASACETLAHLTFRLQTLISLSRDKEGGQLPHWLLAPNCWTKGRDTNGAGNPSDKDQRLRDGYAKL